MGLPRWLHGYGKIPLCPHLHLPLQSGSNTVLRRMIRRCTVESYEKIIQSREQDPNFHITSDQSLDSQGTDKEFEETRRTLERSTETCICSHTRSGKAPQRLECQSN